MRTIRSLMMWAVILQVANAAVTAKEKDAPTTRLIVDDDKFQCPTAGFTKIQDAVNAASPGTRIRICAGLYNEQVSIGKALSLEADNAAVIMPSSMIANTTSLLSSSPIAAIVLVTGASDVSIDNVIVDGAANNITACEPTLIGIFYRNSSGEVTNAAVRNIKLSPTLKGCQSGSGVLVQSGAGGTSRVAISGSSVHDYQKNGITANEIGTEVQIRRNVVTGLGATDGATQNGIQIGFGAGGELEANRVANHLWSPCVSIALCGSAATNILVVESDDVRIQQNLAGVSQLGIAIVGDHSNVRDNEVFDTAVFDGIALVGDANEVHANSVTNSGEAGILIDGNSNSVTRNRINEAPVGILKTTGSLGNVIANNDFFNTPVEVQDPPINVTKFSPYR